MTITKVDQEELQSLENALVNLEKITQAVIRNLVSEEEYLNFFEKLSYEKRQPEALSELLGYYEIRIMEMSVKLFSALLLMRVNRGWVCPKCGKVNTYWMQTCPCENSQQDVTPSK
jgi:hypothetical protein